MGARVVVQAINSW